ncbi:MAG: hypothetical protein QOF48_3749 [Verrucomicrobiota bacterium]|jgi:hypothetical protein
MNIPPNSRRLLAIDESLTKPVDAVRLHDLLQRLLHLYASGDSDTLISALSAAGMSKLGAA